MSNEKRNIAWTNWRTKNRDGGELAAWDAAWAARQPEIDALRESLRMLRQVPVSDPTEIRANIVDVVHDKGE